VRSVAAAAAVATPPWKPPPSESCVLETVFGPLFSFRSEFAFGVSSPAFGASLILKQNYG